MYLAKAAFSQDLVENKAVHIEAGQMRDARLRCWAGPLPDFAIRSRGSFLETKAPHINPFISHLNTCAHMLAAFTECLCVNSMEQPLTVDVQISQLGNAIIDPNVRKAGQGWVRAPGGGFLMKNNTKSLSTLFLPLRSVHPDINTLGCYGNDVSAGVASLKHH